MRLGIVGSEASKFTAETEKLAREVIVGLILSEKLPVKLVVSGECHLGGIDAWARQEAERLKMPYKGFPPRTFSWADGYKPRNIQIAENSDLVVCITVKTLPEGYKGMRFDYCYHCETSEHIKSGGCWTVKYAKRIGRSGEVIVI